jgi:hypothetical protein
MKILCGLMFILALGVVVFASPGQDRIKIEAVVVTQAELHRYMADGEERSLRPSTRAELESVYADLQQPVYLVVRLLPDVPGHYAGELEIKVDAQSRAVLPVALHYPKGWVEYFIPLSGIVYARKRNSPWELVAGNPIITTKWTELSQK